MNLNIDYYTIQLLSISILFVFSTLFMLLWLQDRKAETVGWWCISAIFITLNAVSDFFPEYRTDALYIHYISSIIAIGYFFLMVGCFKFLKIPLNKYYLISAIIIYLIANIYGYYNEFTSGQINMLVGIAETIILLTSIMVILKLETKYYLIEKIFFTLLLIFHLFIHVIWFMISLNPDNFHQTLFNRTMALTYIVDAFIIIGFLLLILARIRHQLELKNTLNIITKDALSMAVTQANVANKSKSIFLTNMSHELRTPLNIILGFSEVLNLELIGLLNKKQKEFVEDIHKAGKKLLLLINDLLSLSNIQAENLKISLEKITPIKLIDSYTSDLTAIAIEYERNIHIINNIPDDILESEYKFDSVCILQILKELIDNAAKYGSKDGNIWLNYFLSDEDHIRISVKDDGIGIEKNQHHNIFKPFNRAGYNVTGIDGSGAGLSIAKGLIEAMGGTIHYESSLGIGSIFWIDIKLVKG